MKKKIICIIGFPRTGKDMMGQKIIELDNSFKRLAFADNIREEILEREFLVFPGVNLKELVYRYGWENIKDNQKCINIVDNICETFSIHNDRWDSYDIAGHISEFTRNAMYIIGEFGRKVDKYYWTDKVISEITGNTVITDMRFYHEYERLKDLMPEYNIYVFKSVDENIRHISYHPVEYKHLEIPADFHFKARTYDFIHN